MTERLVGRHRERARLEALLDRARGGSGALVLLAGEAGVGKTRLAAAVAADAGLPVLRGAATQGGTPPYGPLVAALRSRLRAQPGALDGVGPLRAQLALLLPELGEPATAADRPTLFEALRAGYAHLAAAAPAVVLLDDLQWSDEATLEVLAALAEPLGELPLLVLAAYRSDGLPRSHGLRRLRNDLRRAGTLEELVLGPLTEEETAALLAEALGAAPDPAVAAAIHARAQGIPFFAEELAEAIRRGDEPQGLPDTVRDAVLVAAAELSPDGRAAAEVAAVAGEAFAPEQVAALAGDAGLGELLERGLVYEGATGETCFRHALAREALYADVPWARRRTLHRALAEELERTGGHSGEVAEHWLGAREPERARAALLRAASESEAVHAYRDAVLAGRRALELWPPGADAARRAEVLERYARCCQPAGDLAEAAGAWRELVALRTDAGDRRAVAHAQRGLAAALELAGERDAALAARTAAAEAFAATGAPAEAAVERLAIANQRRLSSQLGEAVALARTARADADAAGRLDLQLRAMGIEGMAQAKHDDYPAGLATVRNGLALALEHDLTAVAAELYQRLSVTLYEAAELPPAEAALDTAMALCRASPDAGTEVACVTCMAYVLRERGSWARAGELSRELIAQGRAVYVAQGMLGSIHAYEGRYGSARRLLASSLAAAAGLRHYNMTVDTTSALARVAAAQGDAVAAAAHCRAVLARWEDSDDRHYAIGGLRWAAAFLAVAGDRAAAHACTEALSRIAASTGHPDALAALAHALGETALLEGDAATAAVQLGRAVELHRELDLPFERAQIELRAGAALAAAGEREDALERLGDAYRAARRLGARPLAAEAAGAVKALGESVTARLGVRADADAAGGGLSRREREVLRHVAGGDTNRQIAQALFLSPRTVDMHVRNILRKLDARSRTEAAARAREQGLVG